MIIFSTPERILSRSVAEEKVRTLSVEVTAKQRAARMEKVYRWVQSMARVQFCIYIIHVCTYHYIIIQDICCNSRVPCKISHGDCL